MRFDPKKLGPFSQASFLSSELDKDIASSVPRLLYWRCPLAILWAVVLVVILSINGHTWWALTHISQKVIKVVPAGIYLNSSSTISRITSMPWVSTTLTHSSPTLQRPCPCISMNEVSFSCYLSIDTATASSMILESIFLNKSRLSASTKTIPVTFEPPIPFPALLCEAKDSEASKATSSQITRLHGGSPIAWDEQAGPGRPQAMEPIPACQSSIT